MNSEPKTPDIAEQLAKLAKLHVDGALSDEEFKALKVKLELAKLHADGAVTDEEFIAIKARLLKSTGKCRVLKKQLESQNFNSAFTAKSTPVDRLPAGKAVVVGLMIGINATVFVLMFLENPSADWNGAYLVSWGADYGPLTLNGQFWRLLTSTFLHFNFLHIAGNMGCLFYWGTITERALGSRLFLFVYLLCGVLASLTSVVTNRLVVSAGASGSIAGVLGVMCVMWLRGDARVTTQDVLGNLAINALLGFAAGVDWVAHVGGLMSGLVLGALLLPTNSKAEKA